MIVVDVNVIAYLLIPGQFTARAEALLEADASWAAPRLWRSELRNILATYLRGASMDVQDALELFQRAADLIGSNEFEVDSPTVLRLCKSSGCSAYDCEYVALAEFLDVPLFTADRKLSTAFPQRVRLIAGD